MVIQLYQCIRREAPLITLAALLPRLSTLSAPDCVFAARANFSPKIFANGGCDGDSAILSSSALDEVMVTPAVRDIFPLLLSEDARSHSGRLITGGIRLPCYCRFAVNLCLSLLPITHPTELVIRARVPPEQLPGEERIYL